MKTYAHLFQKLFRSPLMLHAPIREHFEFELLNRMGISPGGSIAAGEVLPFAAADGPLLVKASGEPALPYEDSLEYRRRMSATNAHWRVEQIYTKVGPVAIISIVGAIDKHISDFEMSCYGGCDLSDVDHALQTAAADPQVQKIVLRIHSPGGSVVGVPETAARVAALRETHEVHAYSDGMCCSAAYYIASQADQITFTPSAIVGSIGVYMAVLDATKWMELEGLKIELIKAGRLKAMGAYFKPLAEEEREFLQTSVDALHAEFKAAVTTLRKVDDETMQGQWFDGRKSQTLNLADAITTANLDEFVIRLMR